MRWIGNAASVCERRGAFGVLVDKSEGKKPLGRLRRRWEVILKWIFKKWTGLIWLRVGTGDGFL
jgi:hypothetical protein